MRVCNLHNNIYDGNYIMAAIIKMHYRFMGEINTYKHNALMEKIDDGYLGAVATNLDLEGPRKSVFFIFL